MPQSVLKPAFFLTSVVFSNGTDNVKNDPFEVAKYLAAHVSPCTAHSHVLFLQSSPCLRRQGRQALSCCSAAAVSAPAPSVPADVGSLPQADRAALAEELGYRSIGADLPSNVTLTDVISSLPKSVSTYPAFPVYG